MKREYTEKEIERILNQEIEIPECVEQKMEEAYQKIGVKKSVKKRKYHRFWRAAAAAAVLAVGIPVTVAAASKFFSANVVVEEEKVKFDLKVDREQEAHEIEVQPGYMPEGYVYGDENSPYGEKWHNYETDGSITIIPLNAAELDEMARLGEDILENVKEENFRRQMTVDGKKLNLFVLEGGFVDSDKTVKQVYLADEEEGYMVIIFSHSNLPEEEIIKVAENLEIQVLDSTVQYKADEEIEAIREAILEEREIAESEYKAELEKTIGKEQICDIGEELQNPDIYTDENGISWNDNRYTVESVEIKDSLPAEEYPAENFVEYEERVAEWVNEDRTLKTHVRSRQKLDENREPEGEPVQENVNSKYVVVKMKLKNWNEVNPYPDYEAYVEPRISYLYPAGEGTYSKYSKEELYPANEKYHLQIDGFPVYFDAKYYTEGIEGKRHVFFLPIEPGQECEYTLVYVVDEDRLEDAFLKFYSDSGSDGKQLYVKVRQ